MDADRTNHPHPDNAEPPPPEPATNGVDEAEEESFPASDPPARTVVTGTPAGPIDSSEQRRGNS